MDKSMNNNYRSNFNKAVFSGNLAFAPRLTSFDTKSGKRVDVVYYTILSDDYYNGYKATANMNCVTFGKKAVAIAKGFKRGDFVEATGKITTYPTKRIQGVTLKYPVTITRFNIYKLDNLMSSNKNNNAVVSTPKASSKQRTSHKQTKTAKKPADPLAKLTKQTTVKVDNASASDTKKNR